MVTDKEKFDITLEMTSRWYEDYDFTGTNIAEELGVHYCDFDDVEEFNNAAWKALIDAIKPNYNHDIILLTARAMEEYGDKVTTFYGSELKLFAEMILESLEEEREP